MSIRYSLRRTSSFLPRFPSCSSPLNGGIGNRRTQKLVGPVEFMAHVGRGRSLSKVRNIHVVTHF